MALVVFVAADSGVSPENADDMGSIALPSMRISITDPIAVGSMAIDTRIIRVSAEIEKLLGERPAALRDTLIVNRVHPDDVATFLLALGRALDDGAGVGLHVRVRRRRGDYGPMRMLVSPATNSASTRLGFVLTREPTSSAPDDDRVAGLEQHLWRIAVEVQAAGVTEGMHGLPDVAQIPGSEDLTTRQWQILTMLLRGDRVPGIARALYVSRSTVRSHLAAIFRKLDVHSQAELIALFRDVNQQNA
jgi:PAS domain S-box-containing protein